MIEILLKSKIFPVVEFSLIISLIIVTYWGMHIGGFKRVKPPVKFTFSMFLGSIAYMAAKMIVTALFTGHTTPDTAYAF